MSKKIVVRRNVVNSRKVIIRHEVGCRFSEPYNGEASIDIERENKAIRLFYDVKKYPNMTNSLATLAYSFECFKRIKTPAKYVIEMMSRVNN